MRVIAYSGSDASYDLLAEATDPKLDGGVSIVALSPESQAKGLEVWKALEQELAPLVAARDYGVRLRLFQRVPPPFVWRGRIAALLERADAARRGPPAADSADGAGASS